MFPQAPLSVCLSVCLFVCLFIIRVDCVQIAMQFGGMVRIGPGQGESTVRPGKQVYLTFNWLKWNTITNMLGDMAETLVTDYFTLLKLGQVHQCLNSTDRASKAVWS